MSILFDWKIQDIERKVDNATRRLYELDTLSSNVDRLEHSLREVGSIVDGFRHELETAKDQVMQLESVIAAQLHP